ncbi:hypothetical protein [Tsukamurella sputi]|uniref:hypothetical protein n=1 Tax=Tsukamurella sputi TaxID=2591848 RepID=UPI001315460E|nr:hypothetical protein [Tsukamurella sputi]
MKSPNLWPTHKGRARGKKARHRAAIRSQRAGKTTQTTVRRPAAQPNGAEAVR